MFWKLVTWEEDDGDAEKESFTKLKRRIQQYDIGAGQSQGIHISLGSYVRGRNDPVHRNVR